ncbi:hypothetical protein [Paenibacillus sp. NFR01]|uniref:hypothetical protein n=1 Tax=Paenibacillus sp. NFR01 TaxID=1566279 RepID=UPI0008D5DE17|nr:hypothetical protein [Paenibacillus sp. NFR01]SET47689.1 hypothetical protein SAMN03159358_1795 [Paenibacillus sp. NFR01]
MKRSIKGRKTVTGIAVLTLLSVFGSGCGTFADKPAGEDLGLALAGMDGSDGVTFEGSALLMLGSQAVPHTSLYYGGKMVDHSKVSLHSLLPDKSGLSQAASQAGQQMLEHEGASAPYYSQLEKKDGQWAVLTSEPAAGIVNPLPSLNPVKQLEELENLEKTVTEEPGYSRTSRVLRIELSPAAAKQQLTDELEREMAALRPAAGKGGGEEALTAFWEQKEQELKAKLAGTNVKSVYKLTIDAKRNLPRQLNWTRTVQDEDGAGAPGGETFVNEVKFYGYR